MRVTRQHVAAAVCACMLLATLEACVKRPLPEDGDGTAATGGGATGQGGGGGTSCSATNPRLDLVGAPLLVLDRPLGSTNLYTSLLWTGEEYLFFWRVLAGDGVFMQRLDASGQAIGGNIRVRGYESAFDVAWSGDRLAAAWTRQSTGGNVDLTFQTFDGVGRPMVDAITLRSAPNIGVDGSVLYGPRIAPIAGGFVIAWYESEVMVATVDADGSLRNGPVSAGGADLVASPHLGLAAAEDRILVGWNGRRASTPPSADAVTATRAFSGGLAPLDSVVLDQAAFAGSHQLLATPGGFLALWTHGLPSGTTMPMADAEVRLVALDRTGAPVAGATLAPPVVGPYPDAAPAVWNDDHLVVLWDGSTTGAGHLTLSRFAPDGAVQGEAVTLPTMAPASRLTVTAHDRTVAFIWSEEILGAYEVYFQQARSCP